MRCIATAANVTCEGCGRVCHSDAPSQQEGEVCAPVVLIASGGPLLFCLHIVIMVVAAGDIVRACGEAVFNEALLRADAVCFKRSGTPGALGSVVIMHKTHVAVCKQTTRRQTT